MIQREVIVIRRGRKTDGTPAKYSIMPGRTNDIHEITLNATHRTQLSRLDERPGHISASGFAIRDITEKNPDTKALYDHLDVMSRTGVGRNRTIVFEVDDEDDAIAWETLRLDDADFVSMYYAPVIRQVTTTGAKTEYPFLQPIKILVILSATPDATGLSVSAFDEWQKLEETFRAASRRLESVWNLSPGAEALHVVVMTNEEALFDQISRAAIPWVECGAIQSEAQLRALKERIGPHLIHVFCHGEARERGKICLSLGSQASFHSGVADVEITPSFFEAPDNQAWVVTLNACSTAAGGREMLDAYPAINGEFDTKKQLDSEIRNFARLLLQKRIPAVLGMRERVGVDLAATTAENFYSAFLEELAAVPLKGAPREIDFGHIMIAVRREIHRVLHGEADRTPRDSCAHWPIPLLYVNSDGLRLVRQGQRTLRAREIVIAIGQHKEDIADVEAQIAELEPHQARNRARLTEALETTRAELSALERDLELAEAGPGEPKRYLNFEDKQIVRAPLSGEPVQANTLVDGVAVTGKIDIGKLHAAGKPPDRRPQAHLGSDTVDRNDWLDPRVGWGLIADRGAEIPASLQQLLAFRNGKIFRYDRAQTQRDGRLFLLDERYEKSPSVVSAQYGMEIGAVPRFLLIYGGPDVIPWSAQYQLNANRAVGRLHIDGEALDRYVRYAMDEWNPAAPPARTQPGLVWATLHDKSDFTDASFRAIGRPLADAFEEIVPSMRLLEKRATCEELVGALIDAQPGVIVTVSHGSTQPLGDVVALRAQLGLPIDQRLNTLDIDRLLERWNPDGAIWYAHACCSAGADATSGFADLFEEQSSLRAVLNGLEALGPSVAPLPTRLLSAPKPARAFIGHVEPTFDWTLRDPDNRALITHPLSASIACNLLRRHDPVGAALAPRFAELGARYSQYDLRQQAKQPLRNFITDILVARDIQRTVIFGDPAVALPAIPS